MMKGSLRVRSAGRCGFTLIELLTVIGIMSILSVPLVRIYNAFHENVSFAQDMSKAEDVNELALQQWRVDVLSAQKVETVTATHAGATASMMRVHQADGSSVLWQRGDDPKNIERHVVKNGEALGSARVFAAECDALEFVEVEGGRGYEMSWRSKNTNGLRTYSFSGSALAVPLNQMTTGGTQK